MARRTAAPEGGRAGALLRTGCSCAQLHHPPAAAHLPAARATPRQRIITCIDKIVTLCCCRGGLQTSPTGSSTPSTEGACQTGLPMTQTHEPQAIFYRAGRFAEPAHSCGARSLLEVQKNRSTRARAQREGACSRARRTACSWMSFVRARSAPARPPSGAAVRRAVRRPLRPRARRAPRNHVREAARVPPGRAPLRGQGDRALPATTGRRPCTAPRRRLAASATRRISAFPARQGGPRCGPALAEVANGCRWAAQPRVGAARPAQRPPGRSENGAGERPLPRPPRGPVLELRRVL